MSSFFLAWESCTRSEKRHNLCRGFRARQRRSVLFSCSSRQYFLIACTGGLRNVVMAMMVHHRTVNLGNKIVGGARTRELGLAARGMDGGINIRMAGLNQQSTELVCCLLVQVWWSVSSRDVAWHPCGAEPIAFPDEDQSSSPPWRCLGTKAQERPDDRGAAHAKARLSFSRMHRLAGIFWGGTNA